MNVDEAIALHQNGQEFIAATAPEERADAEKLVGLDPEYQQAHHVVRHLEQLAGGISVLAQLRADIQTTEELSPAEVESLLADIESETLRGQIEHLSEQQRADIENIHSFINEYQKLSNNHRKQPTRRQEAELQRYLKSGFRERWTNEELVEQPDRFRTVMETVLCKEHVSPQTRLAIQNYLVKKIGTEVMRTETETTPDQIAKRLETSLRPGVASELLQEVFIKKYFENAERHGVDEVLDNYERFVRGVLRVANQPEVCQFAVDIANLKTDLLKRKSLYGAQLHFVPIVSLDRPELMSKLIASNRALHVTKISKNLEVDRTEGSERNVFGQALETIDEISENGVTTSQVSMLRKNYGRVVIPHIARGIEVLGEDEYKLRIDVMNAYMEVLSGSLVDFVTNEVSTETDSDGFHNVGHLMEHVVNKVCETYPEAQEFLEQLTFAEYTVLRELPEYVSDPATNIPQALRMTNPSTHEALFESVMTKAFDPNSEDHLTPEEALEYGLSPDMSLEDLADSFKTFEHRTADGYIISIVSPFNPHAQEPTSEEWETLLEVFADRIEQGKHDLANAHGMRRRTQLIGSRDMGYFIGIRKESEQDRLSYHPLDSLLRDLETETGKDESLRRIEEARISVLMDRRRFLNTRGIKYELPLDDESFFEISIVKHPRNAQYYVCAFEAFVNDRVHTARVLMDRDLNFQLGDKRVQSEELLFELNATTAELLAYFMTQDALETEEGSINEEHNALIKRIAHLRLLPEGQNFSYDRWFKCLEVEGEDLEVLSKLQQVKYETTRNSTYVQAVENDDPNKGPLLIHLPTA